MVALATKLISGLFIDEPLTNRIAIGLIFAELGRSAGVFTPEVYAGLIIVIALSTLLPPFAPKLFYRHSQTKQ